MTRSGYLRWRNDLKRFHASKSAEILREVGYPEDVIVRVHELNLKKNLGRDPECQILEDALCLVMLQPRLADLTAKTDSAKMVGILQNCKKPGRRCRPLRTNTHWPCRMRRRQRNYFSRRAHQIRRMPSAST